MKPTRFRQLSNNLKVISKWLFRQSIKILINATSAGTQFNMGTLLGGANILGRPAFFRSQSSSIFWHEFLDACREKLTARWLALSRRGFHQTVQKFHFSSTLTKSSTIIYAMGIPILWLEEKHYYYRYGYTDTLVGTEAYPSSKTTDDPSTHPISTICRGSYHIPSRKSSPQACATPRHPSLSTISKRGH